MVRDTDQLSPVRPTLRIELSTLACASPGNRNRDLVYRSMVHHWPTPAGSDPHF